MHEAQKAKEAEQNKTHRKQSKLDVKVAAAIAAKTAKVQEEVKEADIDMDKIVSTSDITSLNVDQVKSELNRFGIAVKNKQNKKLYGRLLLEIYTYLVKRG